MFFINKIQITALLNRNVSNFFIPKIDIFKFEIIKPFLKKINYVNNFNKSFNFKLFIA